MFNLIRRISGSVIPRPDRPWRDDATSNAPQIGRKRQRDADDDEAPSTSKRTRGDSTPAADDAEGRGASPAVTVPQGSETQDVKDVTKGVKDVELEKVVEAEGEEVENAPSEGSAATQPPETQVVDEASHEETPDVANAVVEDAATQPSDAVENETSTLPETDEKEKDAPDAVSESEPSAPAAVTQTTTQKKKPKKAAKTAKAAAKEKKPAPELASATTEDGASAALTTEEHVDSTPANAEE
ncbi:hypothetical protein PLICRDRAFT_173548 [Plicaturopsis crispa FD-325 SS-3]|nr:hypothetical protein PLICRDRAFT_173548 [Plicaturopsis crispa FD-325 SS-3]